MVQGLEGCVGRFMEMGMTGPRLLNLDLRDLKSLHLPQDDKTKLKRKVSWSVGSPWVKSGSAGFVTVTIRVLFFFFFLFHIILLLLFVFFMQNIYISGKGTEVSG